MSNRAAPRARQGARIVMGVATAGIVALFASLQPIHRTAPSMPLADGRQAAFGLMLWLGGVVLSLLGAVAALAFVRRRLRESSGDGFQGFTVDDIREMRARGQLSEEEFLALRRRIVGLTPAGNTKTDDD